MEYTVSHRHVDESRGLVSNPSLERSIIELSMKITDADITPENKRLGRRTYAPFRWSQADCINACRALISITPTLSKIEISAWVMPKGHK